VAGEQPDHDSGSDRSDQRRHKDTKWDPAALTETLRKADRVMFPSMTQLSGSPFALIGALAKWRKQATLPKGQSLQQMLPPEQFQRLVALQKEDC
jgi:hypothetical protein